MTKIFNFALKIKGGGREGGRGEVLRPCHPPKIWNVHLSIHTNTLLHGNLYRLVFLQFDWLKRGLVT